MSQQVSLTLLFNKQKQAEITFHYTLDFRKSSPEDRNRKQLLRQSRKKSSLVQENDKDPNEIGNSIQSC